MSNLELDEIQDTDDRRERRRNRKSAAAVVVALLVVVGTVVGVVLGGRALLQDLFAGPPDYEGAGSGEVVVQVEPGDSLSAIGDELRSQDVVASREAWLDAAEDDERATGIQPGFYALRSQMSASSALDRLLDPEARIENLVQLPEGLRLPTALDRMAEGTGLPRQQFTALAKNPSPLGLPEWSGGRLEGFVFPATYTYGPDVTAADALAATVRRFGVAAAETGLDTGTVVDGREYTALEVLTVASLVEAEAPAEAREEVARVVYNRLAQGMPLQLDSTVNYATGKGEVTTTAQDRAVDSPFNTYANDGLPPGPINSPGEAAMTAAVSPADGPWLYFVTVNPDTGETKFAETFEQHQVNVEELRAWLRENPS